MGNKYIEAITVNLIFFLLNTLFFLVITPIAIKVMGDEIYGVWSIIYAIMLFAGIGTLGIASIINKFGAEAHNEDHWHSNVITAGIVLVVPMGLLICIGLIFSRNFISDNIEIVAISKNQFSFVIAMVALSIPFQFTSKVFQGYLLSQLKQRFVRLLETYFSFSLWIGVVLITWKTNNFDFVGWFCLLNSIVVLSLYVLLTLRDVKFYLHVNLNVLKKMFNFSGFMFIEMVAISLFQQMDRVIVGFILGPTVAGIYSVGTSIGLRLSLVTGQITEVMIPFASLRDSVNDHLKLFKVFRKLSQYVSLLLAGFGVALILLMDELLSFWISKQYASNYANYFKILVVAYVLLSLCRPGHQTLTGLGKVKFSSLIYISVTALMLFGLFLASHFWGLLGAVLANLLMVLLLVFNFRVYQILSLHFSWGDIIFDLSAAVFMTLFAYTISQFDFTLFFRIVTVIFLEGFILSVFLRDQELSERLSGVLEAIHV